MRPSEGFFGPDGPEHVQDPESLSAKSVGPEGLDDVDRRAAGRWEDVEESVQRVLPAGTAGTGRRPLTAGWMRPLCPLSDDTRALLGILRRACPWAGYVSRSRGDVTRSCGALRLHALPPEATGKGFAPVGMFVDLPPELVPELTEGGVMTIDGADVSILGTPANDRQMTGK